MSRLAQENLAAVLLLLLFGGVIYLCQDFGPRARMIPLPLAVAGIVLTLLQLLWQNVRSTDELQIDLISVEGKLPAPVSDPEASASPRAASPEREGPAWRRELRAFGTVALLLGLVLAIGIIPAVFVFTAGYFAVTRQYSWLTAVGYTSLFTACIYVLFVVALQIEPYHGLLAPVVERFR